MSVLGSKFEDKELRQVLEDFNWRGYVETENVTEEQQQEGVVFNVAVPYEDYEGWHNWINISIETYDIVDYVENVIGEHVERINSGMHSSMQVTNQDAYLEIVAMQDEEVTPGADATWTDYFDCYDFTRLVMDKLSTEEGYGVLRRLGK